MQLFKGSVLIVDNEEPVRQALLNMLSRECYYCVTASSGQDALDKSAMSDFDVVLLDAVMPGTSGIEVLPTLRQRYPDTRIIMLVAAFNSEIVEESRHLGAHDYITKPFNLPDVMFRVESALASKKLTPGKKQPTSSGQNL